VQSEFLIEINEFTEKVSTTVFESSPAVSVYGHWYRELFNTLYIHE